MQFDEVPIPTPGSGELLVRVKVASVNPIDWKIREGLVAQFFPIEFPRTLGRDGVGEVVALGADVSGWQLGDRVLGVAIPGRDGTHAQYVCVSAATSAPVPSSVADDAAVCLGIAGLSAFIPLIEVAALKAGERVLIHAAAGGVGGLAVQMAREIGAEVIATCSADNTDYVRSLGATTVIDYQREDFVALAGSCDVVLDVMGGEVHQRSAKVLRAGGRLVYLAAAPVAPIARTDIRVEMARIAPTRVRLSNLLQWAAERRIKPQIGRHFLLADLPAAYAASKTGRARGKIIITV